MYDYRAPLADMRFNLYDVLKLDALWQRMPRTQEVTPDLVDAILDEGARITETLLYPLNREGDEQGCQLKNGDVITPPGFKAAFKTYAEGGWIGLGGDPEYGGQGMPKALVVLMEEMLFSANCSFTLYPLLTVGATIALATHADEAIRQRYLPKLYSGEWAAVMDLTEPGAGSDLGIIQTKALPAQDGTYRISGTKIFITGGEQDLTDNIIHLVLAKLPGAPAGSRGISLFLVPKFMVNDDGSLGERNAFSCGALEHKMGIKGSSTAVMNFDGATGYLIGGENQGLACMFTMMNYERLSMGQQGLGLGEMAYQKAAAYAKERVQGRRAGGAAEPEAKADPIIHHADVRRMLMTMRAWNEGGRCFALYVAQLLDIAKFHEDKCERAKAQKIAGLLTPVTKAFMSDRGLDVCLLGQQVFGGHGYIREWGMEQLVRDARIAQIYEGTNGIQCQDLIGRKVIRDNGDGLALFIGNMKADLEGVESSLAQPVAAAIDQLQAVTQWVLDEAPRDPHLAGAIAADYMELFGRVCYGWAWARIATAAGDKGGDFANGKQAVARFYFEHLLPPSDGLVRRIRQNSQVIMALPPEAF